MNALALTDHGNMYGALRFYKACKAAGINADDFIDQLSDYIDSCITFVNSMQDKVAKSKK